MEVKPHGNTGRKHTPEAKERMRLVLRQTGRKMSEATRKKLSEALKGRVFSPESREKMRLAKLGNQYGKEFRDSQVPLAKRRKESWCKTVCVFGVVYGSIKDAADANKVSRQVAHYRLNSAGFKDWNYHVIN